MKLVILILLATLILCTDYRSKYAQGYWQVNLGEFDQVRGDLLMAFADFNLDGFTDIVSVDSLTSTVIAVYLWDNVLHTFVRKEVTTAASAIKSIIADLVDLNFDGYPDMVCAENFMDHFNLEVLLMAGCGANCTFTKLTDQDNILKGVDPVEPFVIDLDGNRIPEIVFVKGGARQIASIQNLTVSMKPFDQYISKPVNEEGVPVFPDIAYPALDQHYASLVDFNNDCMTDLVLISGNQTSKCLEFYTNLRNGQLSQPLFVSIDINIKSMTFADVNFDGAIDLVLLFADYSSTTIELHLNKNALDVYHLCFPFQPFPYDFGPLVQGKVKPIQQLVLPGILSTTDYSIKLADLNLDGYPDMVIPMASNITQNSTSTVNILINTQCLGSDCGAYNPEFTAQSNVSNMRFFKPQTITTSTSSNVSSVAIFDLYQDGKPDILINYFSIKKNVGKVNYIVPILNNYSPDAFFIKIQCQNGVNSSSKFLASLVGVSYQWIVTGLGGNYIPAVATQGMQVSHRNLPLPFVMSGLGRTNNFIQNLYVGVQSNTTDSIRKWSPIVPNTHLIISPMKSPSSWKLLMYLEPTQKLTLVFVLTVLALVLIGMTIYYYHRKEQHQNKENMDSFYVALS